MVGPVDVEAAFFQQPLCGNQCVQRVEYAMEVYSIVDETVAGFAFARDERTGRQTEAQRGDHFVHTCFVFGGVRADNPKRISMFLQRALFESHHRLRLTLRIYLRSAEPEAHPFFVHEIEKVSLRGFAQHVPGKVHVLGGAFDDGTGSQMQADEVSPPPLREALADSRRTQIAAAEVRQHEIARNYRLDGSLLAVAYRHLCAGREALVVIADNERHAVRARQQHEPLVLNGVGVLELVHQHVPEAVLVVLQQRGVVAPQLIGAQQQFGEVHNAGALTGLFIGLVDLDQLTPGRIAVVLDVFRPVAFVLLGVDEPEYFARNPAGLIQVERLQYFAQHARLIFGIQNLETLRQPDFAPMNTQKTMRKPVKSSEPHGAARQSQQRLDAPAHLGCCLVGEGDGKNAVRRCALDLNEPGDPVHQHACLAAARAGKHQGRAQWRAYRLALRLIEAVEKV